MAGAYTLNAYQVNFASVLTIKDENVVKMFKSIETSGLRNFLEAPAIIYKSTLLDFYAKATVEDGKIIYSQGDASISIDAALLGSSFLLPFSGNFECSVISKEEMSTALTSFSASGEELSPSCFKKLLKIEYQVLADIVAKALLVKAGTFDKLTKEKVQMMMAITCERKVDWSRFLDHTPFLEMLNDGIIALSGRVDDLLNRLDAKKGEENRTGASSSRQFSDRDQNPEEEPFRDIGIN